MTVVVDRPAPAARRTWRVLLRAAALAAAVAAVSALVDHGTPEENAVDIGAGLLRIAVLGLVVTVWAALDGRRHGFRRAGQVWTAVIALLATVAVVKVVVDGGTAAPAETAGVVLGLLAVLGLPLVGLAVAGAAAGSSLRGGVAGGRQVVDAA